MSVFLLVGAAPSLRALAHADCSPVLDSERRAPNAITGADIPNDTVLQIKSVVLNSTLVYGNRVTELNRSARQKDGRQFAISLLLSVPRLLAPRNLR